MSSSLRVLGILLIVVSVVPIFLSIFTYKPIEKDEILKLSVEKNIYETVDKESPTIKLYNHNTDKIENIDIEEYLVGVVASEMPSDFGEDALKAQALAARTYVMYQIENGSKQGHGDADVCTSHEHCQAYSSKDELTKIKGQEWMETEYIKIKEAVGNTKGQIITYDSKAILPLYFSTSSGKTENSIEVFATQEPYLTSVDSESDKISPKYMSELIISSSEFVEKIKSKYNKLQIDSNKLNTEIKIIDSSEGGSVTEIKIGNLTFTGRDIRSIFNLNSSNFDIDINNNKVTFKVKGYGHGVGMSQWGANGMSQEGYKYYDIIKHYYTGVDITDIY